ncbi:MAG TPA: DnaJ domain-containing protein [Pseudolysinimonas sp.]|jgi:tetratricopeptide (TPR) repeat protein
MALENYYNILGVASNASAEDIQKAISEKRREWTPRTGHPKLETRQLAESTIKSIADAESVLLDASRRSAYDTQLAAQVSVPDTAPSGPGQGRDWLQLARDHLAQGNNTQANYAAREATTHQSENPEAWYVRGLSSEALGNASDAEFEIGEAVRLNPNDASYHAELGDLYKNNELWEKALPEYTRASELEPDNVYFKAFLGLTEGALDHIDRANQILEECYRRLPNDETIRYFYGLVLQEKITSTWSVYQDGSRDILSEAQVEYSKKQLAVIDSLKIDDIGFRNDLDEVKVVVERAEAVKFQSFNGVGGVVFAELLTIILMFVFFGVGSGFVVLGLLFLGLAVLWIVLYVRAQRVPGWKWSWKQSPAYVRQTGLQ